MTLTKGSDGVIVSMIAEFVCHFYLYREARQMLSAQARGSYVLIVRVPETTTIRVGNLGVSDFSPGYYAYVGSAMAGLKPRLLRHVSKKKTPRWHVDYLTNEGTITSIVVFGSTTRLECKIADGLRERFASVPRFGCGDCDCPSHLFFAPREDDLRKGIAASMAHLDTEALYMKRNDLRRYLGLKQG